MGEWKQLTPRRSGLPKVNLLPVSRGASQRVTTSGAAESHEKAGRLEMALALYHQSTKGGPEDWLMTKRIGDLLVRMNRIEDAVQEYAAFAATCAAQGQFRKAVAAWKQVRGLAPTALDPCMSLGDLYAKQGFRVEAKGYYLFVADEFKKLGKIQESAQALRRIAEIDPDDLKVKLYLADLYLNDGNVGLAIECYIMIARTLTDKGHKREACQVLQKVLRSGLDSDALRLELERLA